MKGDYTLVRFSGSQLYQIKTLLFLISFLLLCRVSPVAANSNSAAIVSAHPLATKAGKTILSQGGNAFDAAVAVSAALAVVESYASGIGGGGFWLLHLAGDKKDIVIDARETAPGNASEQMYLDTQNKPVFDASLLGPGAAAIPGSPAALVHIARKYGLLTLEQTFAPAITLAKEGFKIDMRFFKSIKNHQRKLRYFPKTAHIFLPDNSVPAVGTLFRQPELAETLKSIAKLGNNGFYRGHVAREMVRSVLRDGGIWSYTDLLNYRVIERKPVKFTYRGSLITTVPLPSAGGISLAQGLNILEHFSLSALNQLDRVHLIVEALKSAYRDRVDYLGDSDFVDIPVHKLMSKAYAKKKADKILSNNTKTKRMSHETMVEEGTETTHFSIIDESGNRVAATMSINTFFGSGFVAGNTGVLLNNEMDDFSIGTNLPNAYGLYGGKANHIMPGKRPLSSMSPTFVENDKGVLVLGTPGGSRIISMLLLTIIDYVDNQLTDPVKLVSSPRFHHQYLPDQIEIEADTFDQEWITGLIQKGHVVKSDKRRWGNMQLIYHDKASGRSSVANDPRGATEIRY